ncbi:MAG TPA: GNAT family N-acetyltransferase [Phototrophicaceae bacterium]|nr:GNAT family N-acetyltransferase [Phototrophicaceae bacterium]
MAPELGTGLTGPASPDAVLRLAADAAAADGVAPFNEQSTLAVRHGTDGYRHHGLAAGEELVGYAVVDGEGSGELCVHPGRRRQGLGRRLLDAVLDDVPTVALWAHGNLPGAQALARSAGLRVTRELWQMALDLTGPGEGPHPHSRREQDSSPGEILLSAEGEGALHAPTVGEDGPHAPAEGEEGPHGPAGVHPHPYSRREQDSSRGEILLSAGGEGGLHASAGGGAEVRTFVVGQDEDAWVALNAAAFADHPEQGRMTVTDLRQREAEPWFDPSLLWLAHEPGRPDALLASMWVKPAGEEAEIYALGVAPHAQGRGLGGRLTTVALEEMARRGFRRATLYVEGDNTPAIRTYRRAGFDRVALDVQYAR